MVYSHVLLSIFLLVLLELQKITKLVLNQRKDISAVHCLLNRKVLNGIDTCRYYVGSDDVNQCPSYSLNVTTAILGTPILIMSVTNVYNCYFYCVWYFTSNIY